VPYCCLTQRLIRPRLETVVRRSCAPSRRCLCCQNAERARRRGSDTTEDHRWCWRSGWSYHPVTAWYHARYSSTFHSPAASSVTFIVLITHLILCAFILVLGMTEATLGGTNASLFRLFAFTLHESNYAIKSFPWQMSWSVLCLSIHEKQTQKKLV